MEMSTEECNRRLLLRSLGGIRHSKSPGILLLIPRLQSVRTLGCTCISMAEVLTRSCPFAAFDEIDYLNELLGKHFVDVAWKTYAGIPQVTTKEKLQELYERVDQRKNRMQFPQVAMPVASFVQFLQSYVVSSVSQNQHGIDITDSRHALMDLLDQNSELARSNRTVPPAAARPFERGRSMSADRGDKEDSKIDAARGLSATARLQRTRSYCPPKQSQLPPRSLEHVQSKIQPELQARRDKILRVKKNQTQLMKEQIARARLAEYEAKKDAEVNFTYARKMPLDEITSGTHLFQSLEHELSRVLIELRRCCRARDRR